MFQTIFYQYYLFLYAESTRGTEEPTPTVAVPLHVYIVAGAGGCTLIALLMLIFIVVKLCKKYRMKKELQRVFKVRVNTCHLVVCTSDSITAKGCKLSQQNTLMSLIYFFCSKQSTYADRNYFLMVYQSGLLFSFHLPGERWLPEPYVQS